MIAMDGLVCNYGADRTDRWVEEKQEVHSRDKEKHMERNDQLFVQMNDVCGRTRVTRDEERVLH